MRVFLSLLLPASLMACAVPQTSLTGENRIQIDTAAGLARFDQEEEELNRAYACGLAAYPEIARMERKVRGYAEANTPRTSPAELHARASKIAREFGKPSAAGCINARARWAGLQRAHATTEPTRFTSAGPILPSAGAATVSAEAAGRAGSAAPGRFREFELDTVLVIHGVACHLVDVAPATMLIGRMADYWHSRSPDTARDALMQRASDVVSGMGAMPRPDCALAQFRLVQLLGRYKARLVGERRQPPRSPYFQAAPQFRFKEPERRPDTPAPFDGPKIGPGEVSDL